MKQGDRTELESILNELAQICTENSLQLVTAESCTGGGMAYEITSIAGSSHWFERGFVTYSNLSKTQMLGVQKATLQKFGAVSEEVVREMAKGALQGSDANISLAITGIAGPEGGSEKKPVGSCWFGWSSKKLGTLCKEKQFPGDRMQVRSQAILFSLAELLKLIKIHY